MKLGPQGDKKGLGQDMRKDGSIDGGHHLKVSLSIVCKFVLYLNRCMPNSNHLS